MSTNPQSAGPTTPPQVVLEKIAGKVKKVNSGDTVVIWTRAAGGPPSDAIIHLANITAPKCAAYTNQSQNDEPLGWEAREFLRKELVGQDIVCEVEHRSPKAVFGYVYKGTTTEGENMVETIVSKGYASVKDVGKKNERYEKLKELQEAAKTKKIGMWADDKSGKVRNIVWSVDDAASFVDQHKKKSLKAVVEGVHPSACGVRAFLTLEGKHFYVTVMLSGIRGPNEESNMKPRALYYLEVGLLHQEVEITLDAAGNNGQMFGQLKHPQYDIVKGLIDTGLAQTADWSLSSMDPAYATELRKAEQVAKDKKIGIWTNYKAPVKPAAPSGESKGQAKVTEIISADMIVVKEGSAYKKFFLASIRPPRKEGVATDNKSTVAQRMFQQPLLFQAREFLRQKLVGKQVNYTVDYVQPKSDQYPEKICVTVMVGELNVAAELVRQGLASVIRYRQENDQRSSQYLELQSAEGEAQKNGVGIHAKKEPEPMRVVDLQGDLVKSKGYFSSLQRSSPNEGIVEFVSSGSRIRVYCPKHNCLFAFLFNGISCPRSGRPQMNNQPAQPGEPYGDEALAFSKDYVLQHQISMEIESQDKNGAMIGWGFSNGKNMSVELVKQGLASVHHYSAEKSKYYRDLCNAEEAAKTKRIRIWKDFVEPAKETATVAEEPTEDTKSDRKVDFKGVMVSEITDTVSKFYVQLNDDGPKLEEMQASLQKEMKAHPPMAGAYTPKRGDRCVAKFADGSWYRAKIEKMSQGKADVFYIDYGNRETTDTSKLASCPGAFAAKPEFAHPCHLAFIQMPKDEEALAVSKKAFQEDVGNAVLKMNLEYKNQGENFVSLFTSDGKTDIGKGLIADGIVYFEARRGERYRKLCSEYEAAQDEAKKERKCLWMYGDAREDETERN